MTETPANPFPEQRFHPPVHTGLALCDIVGHSRLHTAEQVETVQILTRTARTLMSLMSERLGLTPLEVANAMVPTGDGFYIVMPTALADLALIFGLGVRNQLLRLNAEAGGVFEGVRVAAHFGEIVLFSDLRGGFNFVGDGMNECARLLSLGKPQRAAAREFAGDENWAVMSAEFEALFERTPYLRSERFTEHLRSRGFRRSEPFDIEDKHGLTRQARLIEVDRASNPEPPLPADWPERIAYVHRHMPRL